MSPLAVAWLTAAIAAAPVDAARASGAPDDGAPPAATPAALDAAAPADARDRFDAHARTVAEHLAPPSDASALQGRDAPTLTVGRRSLFVRADDAAPSLTTEIDVRRVTLDDAPTTPATSFLASSLTSFTGLVSVIGLVAQPSAGLPFSAFNWRARLGAGLFLLSAGPSVGDLLNGDSTMFFVGAGVRSLICGLAWASLEGAIATGDGALIGLSVLLVTVGGLVWSGWCAADLVRSLFAPERWVTRKNQELMHPRAPIAEVRRAGGLAFAY